MIREMNDSDIENVFKIQNESITHPWTLEMFNDDYKDENSFYLVNEETFEDKKIITSYIAYKIVLDEATLMSIATNADYRNKGYADLLLNKSFEILKEKNIEKIFLEVRTNNNDAINLYKKNNFEEMSVRKNYYKDPICDGLVMIKKL